MREKVHAIFRVVTVSINFGGSLDGCQVPRPSNVPLLRALWSLLVGIWGILKGSWGCWYRALLFWVHIEALLVGSWGDACGLELNSLALFHLPCPKRFEHVPSSKDGDSELRKMGILIEGSSEICCYAGLQTAGFSCRERRFHLSPLGLHLENGGIILLPSAAPMHAARMECGPFWRGFKSWRRKPSRP